MPSMARGAHVFETVLRHTTIAIILQVKQLPLLLCFAVSAVQPGPLRFITISLCSSAGFLIRAVVLPWLGLRAHSPEWWSVCRQWLQLLATLLYARNNVAYRAWFSRPNSADSSDFICCLKPASYSRQPFPPHLYVPPQSLVPDKPTGLWSSLGISWPQLLHTG